MTHQEPSELLAVATALPRHLLDAAGTKSLVSTLAGAAAAERWCRMVDGSRVRTRHSVVPLTDLLRRSSLTERNEDYAREAVELGAVVAADALAAAGVAADRVGTIISLSCTGYMLPSLDALLVPRLGLRANIRRIPITELGCSAGIAALGIASQLAQVDPAGNVLLVAVEPCSLCLQVVEPTPSDLLGSILFGDGAAAALVGPAGAGPAVLASASVLWPDTVDQLGMELTTSGFRFLLSPALPALVRARVRETVAEFLHAQGIALGDIGFWVVHPGGPRILDAVSESLGLDDQALAPSWAAWERHGNVSSATVFFIMRDLCAVAPPPAGTLGVMVAFGPGVTCEMVLLRSGGWLAGRAHS